MLSRYFITVGTVRNCVDHALVCLAVSRAVFNMTKFPLPTVANNEKSHTSSDRIERHCLRFVQSPHCAANCLEHVRSSGQGAIVCKSHATHGVPFTCNMSCTMWYDETAQLLSLTEFESHLLTYVLMPIAPSGA